MKKHFPEYDQNKAPGILMPKEYHAKTKGVYLKWRARMGETFDWDNVPEGEIRSLSKEMFTAAGVPANIRRGYWTEFERMKRALSG